MSDVILIGSENTNPMSCEELIEFYKMMHTAFPDFNTRIQEQIANEDRLIKRGINRGTHEANCFGILATENKIEFGSIIVCRIENGKILKGNGVC